MNLLDMPTKLHYKKKINGGLVDYDMSPKEFALMRNKHSDYNNNTEWLSIDTTFKEFRDDGPRGNKAFIEDIKSSINNKKFGPSWDVFIKTLINGNLFAIITTRGHEPDVLRESIIYIIENVLSHSDKIKMKKNLKIFNFLFNNDISNTNLISEYLNNCYFIGLTSNGFIEQFGYSPVDKLENAKQDAIKYFLNLARKYAKKIKTNSLQIGFSDDDVKFIDSAKELFLDTEKSQGLVEYFYVFDTSNKDIKGGVKTKI